MRAETDHNAHATNRLRDGRARLRAAWLIERWRRQGFNAIACYPSGYCRPANSAVVNGLVLESHQAFPIGSEDAVAAVAAAIASGVIYRA